MSVGGNGDLLQLCHSHTDLIVLKRTLESSTAFKYPSVFNSTRT